jgi:cardiolipin synthase
MTLANQLTVLRILLIRFCPLARLRCAHRCAHRVLLTGISDVLDGYIARTWRQQTTLGTFLDLIADKLLMVTTFATLACCRPYPVPGILLIGRDVLLSLVIGIVLWTTGRRLRPTLLGRAAIFGQTWTVALGLFFHVFEDWPVITTLRPFILLPIFVATALLAIAAGVHYIYQLVRMLYQVEAPLGKRMPVQ